jgi:hypothetical protein
VRAVLLTLTLLLTANGCPQESSKPQATEDTSDETVLQFHKTGQLQYGKWYEPQGNTACQWRVETKPAGDDVKPRVLESGTYDDALRVAAETPGRDVFLRFNRACGRFKEAR